MARTITLTNVRIVTWRVDVEQQRVVATYEVLRDDGTPESKSEAIFWINMPAATTGIDGKLREPPDNWYQLPAGYVQTLTALTADVRSGLLHLINE